MKLQYAFGNPRGKKKGKKKPKKARKGVAKRRKSAKTNRVKTKLKEAVKHMAKRKRKGKKPHHDKKKHHRKGGKKSNPIQLRAFTKKADGKPGKMTNMGRKIYRADELEKKSDKVKKLKAVYDALPISGDKATTYKKLEARKALASARADLRRAADADMDAENRTAKVYEEEGKIVKFYRWDEKEKKKGKKGGKTVAKTKKKPKKPKKKTKAQKKAAAKAARKKAAKKSTRKAGKKAGRKKGGRKKGGRRKGARRSRRSKMVRHTHAKSTRHIRKGSKAKISARKRKGGYRIKAHFGKGKKKVRVSGRLRSTKSGFLKGILKINPFRSNPMNKLKDLAKSAAGRTTKMEVIGMFAGTAIMPLAYKGFSMIPGSAKIISSISGVAGPDAGSAVAPLLLGAVLNIGSEKLSGPAKQYVGAAGDGLIAVALVGLFMSLSKRYVHPALGVSMAGVEYTPSMRGMGIVPQLSGVNYTPDMRGVNYTPDMRGMGSSADFGSADYGGGGGYTEAHNRSRADFGAYQSEDSEAEGLSDEDNSYSSSMN